MIKNSKTSTGLVVVSVPPPKWDIVSSREDSQPISFSETQFKNVFVYNYYLTEERRKYHGFSKPGQSANPTFDFSSLESAREITGHRVDSATRQKVPSYIRLVWSAPRNYNQYAVGPNTESFRYWEIFTLKRAPEEDFAGAQMRENYDSFELQQRDFVRFTNEYLDLFSSSTDGGTSNEWFAEEIDSSGYIGRQNFLWNKLINDQENYKNFIGNANTDWLPDNQHRDVYFNNGDTALAASMVDVTDSSLLENLNIPNIDTLPEDILIVKNTNFAWRHKILSHSFSSQILSSQERMRSLRYWSEYGSLKNVKDTHSPLRNYGPLEQTVLRGKPYITKVIEDGITNIGPFELVGYVIEKEQNIEAGEVDERNIESSEKFPFIFVSSTNSQTESYLDAAINYDKEYRYTVRAIYSFYIDVTIEEVGETVRRSYFVCSPYSTALRVETRETQPPPPPRDISAYYEFQNSSLVLNWAFPVNSQRDTAYFAIFRRNSIYEPFRLLQINDFNYSISDPVQSAKEIKLKIDNTDITNRFAGIKRIGINDSNTTYEDFNFIAEKDYIYAICTIDAHGQCSNFSPQLKINLDSRTNKLSIKQISPPGAPLVFPNWFIKTKAFVDVARTAKYRRAILRFRPDYKRVKLGPQDNQSVVDIVKSTSEDKGGNANNCYYLQILNPDRKEDIVLKYQIDDSTYENISNFEDLLSVARKMGISSSELEYDN